MSIETTMQKLRELCDEKTWPKHDLIFEGELLMFVSDDPLEDTVRTVSLHQGALQ